VVVSAACIRCAARVAGSRRGSWSGAAPPTEAAATRHRRRRPGGPGRRAGARRRPRRRAVAAAATAAAAGWRRLRAHVHRPVPGRPGHVRGDAGRPFVWPSGSDQMTDIAIGSYGRMIGVSFTAVYRSIRRPRAARSCRRPSRARSTACRSCRPIRSARPGRWDFAGKAIDALASRDHFDADGHRADLLTEALRCGELAVAREHLVKIKDVSAVPAGDILIWALREREPGALDDLCATAVRAVSDDEAAAGARSGRSAATGAIGEPRSGGCHIVPAGRLACP